jgi:hypothetical protein
MIKHKYEIEQSIICCNKSFNVSEYLPEKFIGKEGVIKECFRGDYGEIVYDVYFKCFDDTIYLYEDEIAVIEENFIKEEEFKI